MTLEELCNKYELSESTVKNNFPRVQKQILKKYDIKIIKEGRGASATYEEEIQNDHRALTIYDETRSEIVMREDSFSLAALEFISFLAIVTTPMLVFRGSYAEFLSYIDMKITPQNIEAVKIALQSLQDREYIMLTIDKTNEEKFMAGLYDRTENEMGVGIDMVRRCRDIALAHHKRSWVPLLKVWVAMQIVANEQPFTVARLESITGLSAYQIRESKKLLEADEIFRTSRAFIGYTSCLGQNVDLNGFYN